MNDYCTSEWHEADPEMSRGAAEHEAQHERRERIRRELGQELIDYIDGDGENGPRHGVKGPTDAEFEQEIDRRIAVEDHGECECGAPGNALVHTRLVRQAGDHDYQPADDRREEDVR